MKNIIPVILCGGEGKRLWPISTRAYPKVFNLSRNGLSFFQENILLAKDLLKKSKSKKIFCITNIKYKYIVSNQLKKIKCDSFVDIICEPIAMNTSAAILSSSLIIKDKFPNSNLIFLSSDYLIDNSEKFIVTLLKAVNLISKDNLVILGNTIKNPSTKFGYINYRYNKVIKFIEKPPQNQADIYFENKNKYLWNMGIFVGHIDCFLKFLNKFITKDYNFVSSFFNTNLVPYDEQFKSYDIPEEPYRNLQNISFDYSVLEKTENTKVVKFIGKWNDYGDFSTYISLIGNKIYSILTNIPKINLFHSNASNISTFTDNNLKKYVFYGINDLSIIDKKDQLVIFKKNKSKEFYNSTLFKSLFKLSNSSNFNDHRPWGYYENLLIHNDCKVKLIYIYPKQRISLQKHKYRSEHWVVIDGTAHIFDGKKTFTLRKNNSYFVGRNEIHQILNKSKNKNLKIIEVQTGSYLSEDDITRLNDPFGRK